MRIEANPKMRTTGCVNISVRPEHTAQVALPRHSYIFPPELSKGPLVRNTRWMIGGHNVLESVASRRREMLGSVLSVRTSLASMANTMLGLERIEDARVCQHRRQS